MIVTFYSFKGGVGRSSSLVEVAVQLAARGRSVAVWDLDLEAPGLQKIPDLLLLDDRLTTGTLDLLIEFQEDFIFPEEGLRQGALLDFPLPESLAANGGRLSFLLPARLDEHYAEKFGAVDWTGLFAPDGAGSAFFHKTASFLVGALGYEILLIDSRTGYTDLGAICTLQLPDLVVLVFNLNEQNLAGIERVHQAVTHSRSRHAGTIPVFLLANMVPEWPKELRQSKLNLLRTKGLGPHCKVPLRPSLLLTDEVPSLARKTADGELRPVTEEIETRWRDLGEATEGAAREWIARARAKGDEDELETLRRRGIFEKVKSFEERVAELFSLQGYIVKPGSQKDGPDFDLRLETTVGALTLHVLVECKDSPQPVTREQVKDFAARVASAIDAGKLPYQSILVARSAFANNVEAVAESLRVVLQTWDQLLFGLVDLRPPLDAAIRAFQGTALERLYVEPDVVLHSEIQPGRPIVAHDAQEAAHRWLGQGEGNLFILLGDAGSGKTSFCRRLACDLALRAREKKLGEARVPVLVDLGEAGSVSLTIEGLLSQTFQRLGAQPINPAALLHQNREGLLTLLCDGFDEMIGSSEPARSVEALRQILRAAEGRAKVILTCRTHLFRDQPEALRHLDVAPDSATVEGATRLWEEIQDRPGIEIGHLLELRDEQIDDYLRKALPPPADWSAVRDRIRGTYSLNGLAARPFLLEILVRTLARLSDSHVAMTLTDLYDSYCESWFGAADFRLTLTREKRAALVEALARMIWDSPQNHLHAEVLAEKAVELFGDRSASSVQERLDHEMRTAPFLHRSADGYYSFVHRSFLEYFVARSLRSGLAAADPRCLALGRLTREVAFFLELWPEAKHIRDLAWAVLSHDYQPGVSENALFLLSFQARAQLGPLAGPGAGDSDPAELRKAFAGLRPPVIRLAGGDLAGANLAGTDLSGANLEGAQLAGADLRQASLEGALLRQADLTNADLRESSFSGADLRGANLDHADARGANFLLADLTDANLSFGRFSRADFTTSRLDGTRTLAAGFLRALLPDGFPVSPSAGAATPHKLKLQPQTGHAHAVLGLSWSPDGSCLASSSLDATIKIWDIAAGQVLATLHGHRGAVVAVAWSPDGERLASASSDATVGLWSATSDLPVCVLEGHASPVSAVAWQPDGRFLASTSEDRTVCLWDPRTGRRVKTLEGHRGAVSAMAWSPDGEWLASASRAGRIRIWSVATGKQVREPLAAHQSDIFSLAWGADRSMLASAGKDGTIKLLDPDSGCVSRVLEAHAHSLAWSSDGRCLAWLAEDGTARLWEPAVSDQAVSLPAHLDIAASESEPRPGSAIAWAPSGNRLAKAATSEAIQIWDPTAGQLLRTFKAPPVPVLEVAWQPSRPALATTSGDGVLRIWNTESGDLERQVHGDNLGGWSLLAWSPDGKSFAGSSGDGCLRLWDAASGRPQQTLDTGSAWFLSIAWSPDGRHVAASASDSTIRLWDASSGRLLRTLKGHTDLVNALAWHPDGDTLASGADDRTVRLWRIEADQPPRSLKPLGDRISALAWSPDGSRLVGATREGTLHIWVPESGKPARVVSEPGRSLHALAWSPAGGPFAAASDGMVELRDPDTGKLLQSLEVSGGRVYGVSWDQQGRRMAVASAAGFVEIWDATPQLLCRLYIAHGGSLAVTADGYVNGPPAALDGARFSDRWALYELTDLSERASAARVVAALTKGSSRRR